MKDCDREGSVHDRDRGRVYLIARDELVNSEAILQQRLSAYSRRMCPTVPPDTRPSRPAERSARKSLSTSGRHWDSSPFQSCSSTVRSTGRPRIPATRIKQGTYIRTRQTKKIRS